VTRLLVGTAVAVAALALIMVAIRLVGGWSAPSAAVAILDLGTCPQPCWFGIQPGKTTFRQALAIFEANHAQIVLPSSYIYANTIRFTLDTGWSGWIKTSTDEGGTLLNLDMSIQYLVLQPPANSLRLGDAVTLFGEPLVSTLCPSTRINPSSGKFYPLYEGSLFFQGNIGVATISDESRFDPQMPVEKIAYIYPADEPPYRFDTPPWRGFARVDDREFCSQ
jgi:hypothetical protein